MPNWTILTPSTFCAVSLFNNQENLTGRSPKEILHWTVVDSPKEAGSSPKEKGSSLGNTGTKEKKVSQLDSMQ